MSAHSVVALALPSVVAFDLATAAQVFGHPDETEYSFVLATPDAHPVRTSTGFDLSGAAGLEALGRADTVVVPGHHDHAIPSGRVLSALQAARGRGTRVVSICTGAFVLAGAGLLDGLRVTTHWQAAAELARRFPDVTVDPDVLYIDHGHVATSAGVAAGIDLCLNLVRRDLGAAVATRIARRMVVPPHRDGGQAQYIPSPSAADATGTGLATTLAWALASLDQGLSVDRLARHAAMSPRHFARRFVAEVGTTPAHWVTHQRVLAARHLLETTDLPLAAVSRMTGLGSEATLRRRFNTELGVGPRTYRRTFGIIG